MAKYNGSDNKNNGRGERFGAGRSGYAKRGENSAKHGESGVRHGGNDVKRGGFDKTRKFSNTTPNSMYNSNGRIPERQYGQKREYDEVSSRDDLIEGRNPVIEALSAGRSINRIMTAKGMRDTQLGKIVNMAAELNIPVVETDRDLMDKMSVTGAHQGVIAMVSAKEYCTVDDILLNAKMKNRRPFVLVLNNLNDPNNFGAIIRCAECAGVDGIIIPQRRSVPVTPVVAKVSAGAVEHVAISRVVNISRTIEYLKEQGLWIAGTDGEGDIVYYDCDLKQPLALVIGSEGEGMSAQVKAKCDFLLKIPMLGQVNSLNAAMAAAVVMFEAVKQRTAANA